MKLSTMAVVAFGLGLGLGACSATSGAGDKPARKHTTPKKMDPACEGCVYREPETEPGRAGGCFKGPDSDEACEARCCIK